MLLMTNIRTDTPAPVLWVWQFIAGVGIGPTMAVFTIIIQNAVPWQKLGVATSNMTFFRQVGGTVGLALAGTIFGSAIRTQAPVQITNQLQAAGVPAAQIQQFSSQLSFSGDQFSQLTGVGDIGANILQQVPEQFRAMVQPLIAADRARHPRRLLAGDRRHDVAGRRRRAAGNAGHAGSPRGAAAQHGSRGEPVRPAPAPGANEPAPAAE